MVKLLIIADDFTGALDTGVQFALRGAATRVVTDPTRSFADIGDGVEVLVLDAETRHLTPENAYTVVARAVRAAMAAGIPYIYKKTDSGLRGNIGAELAALLEASGAQRLPFFPAFPKMGRVTREGVHYIDGVPVAESVFGRDPFEPVPCSDVREIIALQTDVPVCLRTVHGGGDDRPGIQVFDADSDETLSHLGWKLGAEGLRVSAGCAAFAAVLDRILALEGSPPRPPLLPPPLFVACGSVNPVTRRQLDTAHAAGFHRVRLTPEQKLDPAWAESDECALAVEAWLDLAAKKQCCIVDTNDPEGSDATREYARRAGLDMEQVRLRISTTLGRVIKRLLDGGLDATLLCTGGDTLLALTQAVGVTELRPVCEVAPGVVLTDFCYRGKTYHIISKSGGFGTSELLYSLAELVSAGGEKEEQVC